MKIIRKNETTQHKNNDICVVSDYSFGDNDIDLGIAEINGKYPENGYVVNEISKEMIYVLEGNGTIYFEDEKYTFNEGDAFIIEPNEKYYWEANCKLVISCTPPWSEEQHNLV